MGEKSLNLKATRILRLIEEFHGNNPGDILSDLDDAYRIDKNIPSSQNISDKDLVEWIIYLFQK